MGLDELLQDGRLKAHAPNGPESSRLLAAAQRNLADAHVAALSEESRFDLAYKTIMQCAMLALMKRGYRPATSLPGHHRTMIQCLPMTLGVPEDVVLVLDALRKKRNLTDYSGDLIDSESLRECLLRAEELVVRLGG
jgi:hypothetical protein